ncbi:MAG: hypothetical protein ABI120_17225 [Gemmatimonadaceae bacterium]
MAVTSDERSSRVWKGLAVAALSVAALATSIALKSSSVTDSHAIGVRRQLTFEGNVVGVALSPDGLWIAYQWTGVADTR